LLVFLGTHRLSSADACRLGIPVRWADYVRM